MGGNGVECAITVGGLDERSDTKVVAFTNGKMIYLYALCIFSLQVILRDDWKVRRQPPYGTS